MEFQICMLESIEENDHVNKNLNNNLNSNSNKFKNSNFVTQSQVKVFHTQVNPKVIIKLNVSCVKEIMKYKIVIITQN